jgi:hypothetical protein
MGPVLPSRGILWSCKPYPSLVHQRSGLQRVTRSLARHLVIRDLSQLLVNHWQQLLWIGGTLIDGLKDLGEVGIH